MILYETVWGKPISRHIDRSSLDYCYDVPLEIEIMESNNEDLKSDICSLLPEIEVKVEDDDDTESNNYDTEYDSKLEASSFAENSYFSSCLNLFPIMSSIKNKGGKSTRFKNESQEKRAARLARMATRAAERIAAESPQQRKERLSKISECKARRLANESLTQRLARLKKMSIYTANRIKQESDEQRGERLCRMAQYSAKRIANETEEQRRVRLLKMAAYSARRRALKKVANPTQII